MIQKIIYWLITCNTRIYFGNCKLDFVNLNFFNVRIIIVKIRLLGMKLFILKIFNNFVCISDVLIVFVLFNFYCSFV